jgi:hypothetical protein
MTDWRLPENKPEAFLAFYRFHLEHRSHPGCVYALLPAIANAFDLDEDQKAWLVWLNGNTQNVVTSMLLLEAAPRPQDWKLAVDFWNDNFKLLEWDTDRRHQKSKFGEATEAWATGNWGKMHLAEAWAAESKRGWRGVWDFAISQPHMGRLSAWSMIEYARILLPDIPDSDTWMLEDKSGSKSHRNGIAVVAGYDATYWDADIPDMLGLILELEEYADGLLAEVDHPDASRLTMESALCTFKSWHKPNRRYPNVYSDMMYNRIKKAEARFGRTFDLLWEARRQHLPEQLRLEDNPHDPGLSPLKQNWFLETGEVHYLHTIDPSFKPSGLELQIADGTLPLRKDPKWS